MPVRRAAPDIVGSIAVRAPTDRSDVALYVTATALVDDREVLTQRALVTFERVHRIKEKLEMLNDVGLGYLRLGQGSPTLSGGEAQRIKLVTHLAGRGQKKTVLILDEPSIGLHMADIPKMLEVLHRLVDKGATVIVVEHNPDIMREADWVIDMGPGPGAAGGKVVYQGGYDGLVGLAGSRTGEYLGRGLAARPAVAVLPAKKPARKPSAAPVAASVRSNGRKAPAAPSPPAPQSDTRRSARGRSPSG